MFFMLAAVEAAEQYRGRVELEVEALAQLVAVQLPGHLLFLQ